MGEKLYMKWLIASDIHGSMHFCEQLIEAFKREKADRLLILGDILYHGPRNDLPKGYEPKKVISALNEMKTSIICVRGNCDTEVDQMVLDFPILADYGVFVWGERTVYATHGHKYGPDNCGFLKKGDCLLYGHTHIPECREKDGILIMNPGSVSIPKNNSRHSYMIYENGVAVWKSLDGTEYNRTDI